MDAGRLLRKHGVAHRRRFRVLDRIPQERTWQTARLDAGARPRPQHDRSWLCGGVLGPCAGSGDAVQHRAQRRHDLSHRQQHSADLRLGARTHRGQDRHLCDVDRVCDHGRDQLAVPDRAGPQCRGSEHRQEDRQRGDRLGTMVFRVRTARDSVAAAGAVAGLCHLPAAGKGGS